MDNLSDLRKIKLPFNIDDVDKQCHDCIRAQLEKYKKSVDSSGNSVSDKFLIPCEGIQNQLIDPSLLSILSKEQIEETEAALDIVKFAKKYIFIGKNENNEQLTWLARWYQKNVLACTSKRKVLRISRRAGKTELNCIEILYYLFTKKKIKIIVAGPQKTHAEEIIKRIREYIKANPVLARSVVRDVSAPYYEIVLKNGSRVRGFAAGTDGSKGVGMRGQDADKIYLDEMDFIEEDVIQGVIFPILQTNPTTSLSAFSTPTGFKTIYYSLCKENPYYKEFHYDYKVLPWWKNIEMERQNYTEEKFLHEFLAEFSDGEDGVYKTSYIDRALSNYDYAQMHRSENWRYSIGTDWNEKYGTEIVVLGYNIFTMMFQVVETLHIEKSDFTQLTGIQKLLEVNKKWKPSTIYIDAGNGSTNYELLRKISYENRIPGGDLDTARLIDVLKKYDSGSSIKTKDPITHQEVKNPAKAFMVNASVRMFEQNKIRISNKDKKLEEQLRNYIVVRMSPTKVPIYGLQSDKVTDHRLDALNLAIVAFHLEFDDLYAQKILTNVGATIDPRTLNHGANREELLEKNGRPEERRLGFEDRNSIEKMVFGSAPARYGNPMHGIPTNKPGWANDSENIHEQQYLQRKRKRSTISRERPTRSKF